MLTHQSPCLSWDRGPKRRDLCWIFMKVLFVIYAALTWGPFPRLPTKEQQPQGLSVNTIQLGCSGVLSTNWKRLRKKCIFTQTFWVLSVPGCRCNSPSVSSPAWTRLCGRRYKWKESYIRHQRCYQWFGPRCEFHQFAKNRSSHHSTNTLKQSEHKCIIMITNTAMQYIFVYTQLKFISTRYWPKVWVNLIRNDGIVPDPLWPGGGGSLHSLTSWSWLLVTSSAHDIFVSDKFRLWFGVAENFSPSQLWSSVSY